MRYLLIFLVHSILCAMAYVQAFETTPRYSHDESIVSESSFAERVAPHRIVTELAVNKVTNEYEIPYAFLVNDLTVSADTYCSQTDEALEKIKEKMNHMKQFSKERDCSDYADDDKEMEKFTVLYEISSAICDEKSNSEIRALLTSDIKEEMLKKASELNASPEEKVAFMNKFYQMVGDDTRINETDIQPSRLTQLRSYFLGLYQKYFP